MGVPSVLPFMSTFIAFLIPAAILFALYLLARFVRAAERIADELERQGRGRM